MFRTPFKALLASSLALGWAAGPVAAQVAGSDIPQNLLDQFPQPANPPPAAAPAPAPVVKAPAAAKPKPAVAKPAAPKLETPKPEAKAAPPADLTGIWNAKQASPGSGAPVDVTLAFTGDRGAMRIGADQWPLFDVKAADGKIAFTLIIPGTPYITLHYRGTLSRNAMQLASLDEGQGVFTLEGQRQGAVNPAPVAPPPVAAAPAPPKPQPAPQAKVVAPAPVQTAPVPVQAAPVQAAPKPAPVIAAAPAPKAPAVAANTGGLPLALRGDTQAAIARPAPAAPQNSAPAVPAPTPALPAIVASAAPPPARTPAPPPPPAPPPVQVPNFTWIKRPPMGWATREKLGTMVDAEAVRDAADSLDETGLRAAGYTLIEVDDGWQGVRDAKGVLSGGKNFPDMKALGDYVHSKGLKFGLATAATPKSCNGFEGSSGHEEQDAKTFAAWGVDVVIDDWCADAGAASPAAMQNAAELMSGALRTSGRDIVFEVNPGGTDAASWGATVGANLWRTGKDIADNWASVSAAGFAESGDEAFTNPGHWDDVGLIQLGNGGMSGDEYRAQLNLWAVRAAPMMLGNEVRIMTRDTVAALTNAEVNALDQDAMGSAGKRVSAAGDTEVWARPLSNGRMAVAFFNRGNSSAPVAVSWEQLGIQGARNVRDLWWHQDIGSANDRYVVFLNPHTSLLFTLTP